MCVQNLLNNSNTSNLVFTFKHIQYYMDTKPKKIKYRYPIYPSKSYSDCVRIMIMSSTSFHPWMPSLIAMYWVSYWCFVCWSLCEQRGMGIVNSVYIVHDLINSNHILHCTSHICHILKRRLLGRGNGSLSTQSMADLRHRSTQNQRSGSRHRTHGRPRRKVI